MLSSEFVWLAGINLAVILALMVALWGLSVAIRDSSIADIFWGTGPTIVCWLTLWLSDGVASRRLLVVTLAMLWGARLTIYILWRNWGKEDPRYARFRQKIEEQGKSYAWHSLKFVYLLQGALMWVVSLVLIFSLSVDTPTVLGPLAYTGTALWVIGMFFETIADLQLARFKSDPANATKVMDRGLWRYTRHPNYFGEACVWIGFFLIAMDNTSGWFTFVSPMVVLYAVLGPTGKVLLERRMQHKRADFEAYVRRTSGFLPLPPRKS